MMKKGQGLSLNMIIVAILVLIVLVVMVFVFSGKMGAFRESAKSCTSHGGTCEERCTKGPEIKGTDCSGATPKCCIDLSKPTAP
jgi:uncharacterized membrane protein